MKKFIIACFFTLFFSFQSLQSQTIQGIDINIIRQMVSDSSGVYSYAYLLKRFNLFDLGLKDIDYTMLYYGFSASSTYNPYKNLDLEDSLANLTNQKKGKEALELADKVLEKNPVSIFANIEKAYALNGSGKNAEAEKYLMRFQRLLAAVEASGEGSSTQNPIAIIAPKDAEAVILKYKLITISKNIQGENGRFFEVYQVRNAQGRRYPIYFDITIPYTIGMKKLQEEK